MSQSSATNRLSRLPVAEQLPPRIDLVVLAAFRFTDDRKRSESQMSPRVERLVSSVSFVAGHKAAVSIEPLAASCSVARSDQIIMVSYIITLLESDVYYGKVITLFNNLIVSHHQSRSKKATFAAFTENSGFLIGQFTELNYNVIRSHNEQQEDYSWLAWLIVILIAFASEAIWR